LFANNTCDRKKMKAEPNRLIPLKPKQNLLARAFHYLRK